MPITQEAHMLIDQQPEDVIYMLVGIMRHTANQKSLSSEESIAKEKFNQELIDIYNRTLETGGLPAEETLMKLRAKYVAE